MENYLGGGAEICDEAEEIKFPPPHSPRRLANRNSAELRRQDTRAKPQTGESACRLSVHIMTHLFYIISFLDFPKYNE